MRRGRNCDNQNQVKINEILFRNNSERKKGRKEEKKKRKSLTSSEYSAPRRGSS